MSWGEDITLRREQEQNLEGFMLLGTYITDRCDPHSLVIMSCDKGKLPMNYIHGFQHSFMWEWDEGPWDFARTIRRDNHKFAR